MSVFTEGVYARDLTDRFGIGVTLDPHGAIVTVDGPEILRVVGDPNGVVAYTANAGSLKVSRNQAFSG